MFQCPTSGFFLFYNFNHSRKHNLELRFQCPTSGFFLFYPCQKWWKTGIDGCFNALLRASSFSTTTIVDLQAPLQICFNALLRASSFSTFAVIPQSEVNDVFQCPTSGFFLFYSAQKIIFQRKNSTVSMPYFGLLPFLRYASASIDFTGFFSLHFVSNYQTILFSTILSRDFSPFIFQTHYVLFCSTFHIFIITSFQLFFNSPFSILFNN